MTDRCSCERSWTVDETSATCDDCGKRRGHFGGRRVAEIHFVAPLMRKEFYDHVVMRLRRDGITTGTPDLYVRVPSG